MEQFIPALSRCPMFDDIDERDLLSMLDCLSASVRHFEKNEAIFRAGDAAHAVGIVLRGGILVTHEDFWGNRTILTHVGPSGLFAEAFSFAAAERLPVGVIAADDSDIMLVDAARIITTCSSACVFHARLVTNMVRILAQKNIALTQKLEVVAQRTTRDKILSYLSVQALEKGESTFDIPFNRQEFADYLSVDRSALSRELSRMRDEGTIFYQKNWFRLKG